MMKAFQQARKISKRGYNFKRNCPTQETLPIELGVCKNCHVDSSKKIRAYCCYWSSRPLWSIPKNVDKVEEHYCVCDGCMLLPTCKEQTYI
jgi:hypothetical protein